MEFEWDPEKETENRRKHGITFDEATAVFGDDLGIAIPDPDHSIDEERFLVVSYTERTGRIRIISARPLTRQERRQYETTIERPN